MYYVDLENGMRINFGDDFNAAAKFSYDYYENKES